MTLFYEVTGEGPEYCLLAHESVHTHCIGTVDFDVREYAPLFTWFEAPVPYPRDGERASLPSLWMSGLTVESDRDFEEVATAMLDALLDLHPDRVLFNAPWLGQQANIFLLGYLQHRPAQAHFLHHQTRAAAGPVDYAALTTDNNRYGR